MKKTLMKLLLIAAPLGVFGVAYAASRPAPAPSDDPVPMECGKEGRSCQGDGDCCSGYSCKDEGKRLVCRKD